MKTVDELIRDRGGVQAVADLLGVGRTAIWKWRRSNHVPARRAVRFGEVFKIPLSDVFDEYVTASCTPIRGENSAIVEIGQ